MAEAYERAEWNRTASVMALMANINCNKTYSPLDFHPLEKKKERKPGDNDPVAREAIKAAFKNWK